MIAKDLAQVHDAVSNTFIAKGHGPMYRAGSLTPAGRMRLQSLS
ncbi:hypothetical protein [Bradyrhizobium sp. BRP22]|nr:hypothetical protein [Bradyrhizobium sp. BRP22]